MAARKVALAVGILGHVHARLSEKQNGPTCPPEGFTTVSNFDIDAYVRTRWYIQQEMPVKYLPASKNRCVHADYKLKPKKSLLGYDLDVMNYAEDVAAPHKASGGALCAKVVDKSAGKLAVAPCFIPSALAGDYWVIAFDDKEGYALVSGGAPKHSAPGGCRTGTGVNGSGLWIFTRQQKRDNSLVNKVRDIAKQKGFDLSVLKDVDQSSCSQQMITV